MKKTILPILASLLCLLTSPSATAGNGPDKDGKIKPVYDIAFYYNLDNRDISSSGERFTNSMIINAAQLTPLAGIMVNQGKDVTHKVMAGVDIVRNMGEIPTGPDNEKLNNSFLFKEILMYYEVTAKYGGTDLTLDAGIFPRGRANGIFTKPFMSDSVYWVSNNFAGLLAKADRPRSHYEIGLDWYGMKDRDRREEFRVFSYGITKLTPVISAGWRFSGHSYGGSATVGGIVDDILAVPFVQADIPSCLQQLQAELSWLQGIQRDRRTQEGFLTCGGPQLGITAGVHNVFLRNTLYWGSDMMPLYDAADSGGRKYGANLYWGTPFYMVHNDKDKSPEHWGTYDRLEFSWEPRISKYLSLGIGAVLHFNEWRFSGWQQKITLAFNFAN